MKDILLKVLKVFLVVAAVLLAALLCFGLVLALSWPWWVGFFLLLALAGLVVGGFFVAKLLRRRKEQQFVQEVIAQDESRMKSVAPGEREELLELQKRWKEAVETLRRSHLRKSGNPLYVLPWYLVMGESGSGKTTSISSARLSSPFAEVTRVSGVSGTRNCDWWFFEQAILLDTAGRYAIPVDEGRDKEEWQAFLKLLVKYRKKEPLHGLIMTVAADKLSGATPEALEEDGMNMRRRIDELMRALGVRFPVYVLVTKCDLVHGMTRFCDVLPEKCLDQPMGAVNQELKKDVASFLDRAMDEIVDRLRNLRILLMHQPRPGTVDPSLLLFPEELGSLRKGLSSFMQAAFRENPYQETPVLRGVYFSSGRQEGTPFSHFLGALGLIGDKDVLPGTSRGLFLHDFYSAVLPKDRELFAPTKRATEWKLLTRNLGLASYVLIGLALCGLLSFSFVKNLRTIRAVSRDFSGLPVVRGDTPADLAALDRVREGILRAEAQNRSWWVPRFGLNESLSFEAGLKERYCRKFQTVFLSAFDRRMADLMTGLSPATSDELLGRCAVHLARRINLIGMRLDGKGAAELLSSPQPPYIPASPAASVAGDGGEEGKRFGSLYLHYIAWRPGTGELDKERSLLQAWLRHVVSMRGDDFRWLTTWVDRQGGIPAVTLSTFWGGTDGAGDAAVPPSRTRKGKEQFDALLGELAKAHPEKGVVEGRMGAMDPWYRGECLAAWHAFAAAFPKGAERAMGSKAGQPVAARMAGDEGPYLGLLSRMATELEPLSGGEDTPAWVRQLYRIRLARKEGALAEKGKDAIDKTAEKGRELLSAIDRLVGGEGGNAAEARSQAALACKEYVAALTAVSQACATRTQITQLVSQAFGEEPGTGKSPFAVAFAAAARLKGPVSGGVPLDEAVGRLLSGPADFLWAYGRNETACFLQAQWEEKVLADSQGATGMQAAQILLGPDGLVGKFVKGAAAPFLAKGIKGYLPKEMLGGTIPFEPSFLAFSTKGAQAAVAAAAAPQAYPVTIRGLPTDANPEAQARPQSTRLDLQCQTGPQTLLNQNYPVSKVFNWAPGMCGDVTLQIDVGGVALVRSYAGDQGFPEFLRDFPGGRRTFSPSDFPASKGALARLGVRFIRVNYQFSGEKQVAGQAMSMPGQAPRRIVNCVNT